MLTMILLPASVFGSELCELHGFGPSIQESGNELMNFIQTVYPDSQAIFFASYSHWLGTIFGLLLLLIGFVSLVLAYKPKKGNFKPWIVLGLAVAFGIAALMIPEDWLLTWFSLPLEGNSGRNITQIFSLFHSEKARTALFRLTLAFTGQEVLPPVFVYARMTTVLMAMAIPLLVSAGVVLGAGYFLSLVGAASIVFSSGIFQYLVSDHPIGAASFLTPLIFLAFHKVWSSNGKDWTGRFAAVTALIFQWFLSELRVETLALWVIPNLLVLISWLKGQSPESLWESTSGKIVSGYKNLVAQPVGAIIVVLSVVLVVCLSVIVVYLPLWFFDRPRTLVYFPFMMATVFWGGFFLGLIKLASWLSIAAIVLIGLGMLTAFVRPLASWGIGLGFIALMSANWYRYQGHSEYEFVRLVTPMVPVGVLLGIQYLGRHKHLCLPAASGLLTLSIILTLHGLAPEGATWKRKFATPAITMEDNSIEAKYIGSLLRADPDTCLVAPVVSDEIIGDHIVPANKAKLDVIIMRQDMAFRVPLGIDANNPGEITKLRPMLDCICDKRLVYLGLDCLLEGLDYCDKLDCKVIGQTEAGVEFFNNPKRFGKRREADRSLRVCWMEGL